jgi:WD40 repeat protein
VGKEKANQHWMGGKRVRCRRDNYYAARHTGHCAAPQLTFRQPTPARAHTHYLDSGLQIGATWSPDGRFIAYSSNRGGKFDIWVQQLSGSDPVKVTRNPGQNWIEKAVKAYCCTKST